MTIIPTKTPRFIKSIFPNYTWDLFDNRQKKIYLTFDDGPIPNITEFVLDQLAIYNAKATFFCIGDNIKKHPNIFKKILAEGHTIGNHTYHHLKAWKNSQDAYLEDVIKCQQTITYYAKNKRTPKLFRPPYGQISRTKLKALKKLGYSVILWDVLSKDWMQSISTEECIQNVIHHVEQGSIIVFHDSIKASKHLRIALPAVLKHFDKEGYVFDAIV
ncbi:polysaccharide deacetylase family protein [Aquimarina sp. 2201CG1-2-11]|uniref:polysaccharide deacetylase family protein n=1 Tax=Aquimarina discodermiae TaxID=3231043 RepID=UPI003463643C